MEYKGRLSRLRKIIWILDIIHKCDVILTNGTEQLVGLSYNEEDHDAPYILFKSTGSKSYYPLMYAKHSGIVCVEKKLLVNALYDQTYIGDYVPLKYWKEVAGIYARLPKNKMSKKFNFHDKVLLEAESKAFHTQTHILKNAAIKYFQNMKIEHYEDLEKTLSNLAEEFNLDFHREYNINDNLNEYYFEQFEQTENMKEQVESIFNLIVFIDSDGYIFVGNHTFYYWFDPKEKDYVICFIRALLKQKDRIIRDQKAYLKETDFSEEEYKTVIDKTSKELEIYTNSTGIQSKLLYDKFGMTIYLEKEDDNSNENKQSRMYMIVITINEYLRNSDKLWELIASPHPKYKWNFWCRERAYKKYIFD